MDSLATYFSVNRNASYYLSFGFWAFYALKQIGGCHKN
jgi:hypothetical protein